MERETLHSSAREAQRRLACQIEGISHFIFSHPELGLEEYESSRCLIEFIREQGFDVIAPYCGYDTAFRASFGDGGPTIAFLAEYDALPGFFEDKRNGHACGHNWIAAACAGAAAAFAQALCETGVKAKVVLIGTPAEETVCCKVKMVEEHAFDDIDVVIQPHLAEKTSINCAALAMNALLITFRGRASHSATSPWDGINALDAVQLFFAGVNALRQHVRPNIRMHGIVTEGGEAANIVPARAQCLFYVRSSTREYLDVVLNKVYDIIKGAALMTGTQYETEFPELPMDNLVNLPVLQTLAEEELLKEGMRNMVRPEEALELAGSTDIGNVSHVCPTMYIEVALDSESPVMVHEESALSLVDGPYAMDALKKIINVMTGMASALVCDASLIQRAKEELAESTKSVLKK